MKFFNRKPKPENNPLPIGDYELGQPVLRVKEGAAYLVYPMLTQPYQFQSLWVPVIAGAGVVRN